MINTQFFFKVLTQNEISFFSGVPDSLLKNICAYIADNVNCRNHIIAANEGNALALGIGYHLATNKLPLIYMQNSGLGNIINPLLSLADPQVYSVPMILLIGWRGEPGIKDEPQHTKQGNVTINMLNVMQLPYYVLSKDTTDAQARELIKIVKKKALKQNQPHAIIVKKGVFSEYKFTKNKKENYQLTREEAIKIIVNNLNHKDIVVSTTGVASRELFEYREQINQGHEQDFLSVGGMGHANQIAMGIALHKPNRKVFCLDGDGASLMHMGSIAINGNMKCDNFIHIILNNGTHDSVGGQPTVGYNVDFPGIAKSCGYNLILYAETKDEIEKCFKNMKGFEGKVFLEIRLQGGFRKNLGRPSTTPKENKLDFVRFVKLS